MHDIRAIRDNSDAFAQGLARRGLTVGGIAFDPDKVKAAITNAKNGGAPIELLVKNSDRYSTVQIDYHDGLRYPRLERDTSVPARLDDILTPRN